MYTEKTHITNLGNLLTIDAVELLVITTTSDMIPSSRTQKYKNLLGGILCLEKVKLMQ